MSPLTMRKRFATLPPWRERPNVMGHTGKARDEIGHRVPLIFARAAPTDDRLPHAMREADGHDRNFAGTAS